MFERLWFYRQGAPKYFSADYEFFKLTLRKFMEKDDIKVRPRPTQSSHKSGRVERNNGVLKKVLPKIERADPTSDPETIIVRLSFIDNLFYGSKLMSTFQLAQGYATSILGLPHGIVSQELVDAYIGREATRAVKKVLRARSPHALDPKILKRRTEVFEY